MWDSSRSGNRPKTEKQENLKKEKGKVRRQDFTLRTQREPLDVRFLLLQRGDAVRDVAVIDVHGVDLLEAVQRVFRVAG